MTQTTPSVSGELMAPQQQREGRVSWLGRLVCALRRLSELRWHDVLAARTYMTIVLADHPWHRRVWMFVGWTLRQLWVEIPEVESCVTFERPISRTPYWLTASNPLENHPWRDNPAASLPDDAEVVVIGAGFTGGSLAYHWSGRAGEHQRLVVLEMDDPAAGASGRNEGAVVTGRYFTAVRDKMLSALKGSRPELNGQDRHLLAERFAEAYVKAGYRSAELIEQTIRKEGFDCDYVRAGWVQAGDPQNSAGLDESVRTGQAHGFHDWSRISPDEVHRRTGMRVPCPAGFSQGAASWHPAKWVWCLLTAALGKPNVQLFTRTQVLGVEDEGDYYRVRTTRGMIRARHVVSATESYTGKLHPMFRRCLHVHQTQSATGDGGPAQMPPHVVISGPKAFWGRHGADTCLFGSDNTRISHRRAGQNKPSRFISWFFTAHMKALYGPYCLRVNHEWSGSTGQTDDQFPIVGTFDGKRQHIIAGMCGSGSNVSFNAARCVVNRILERTDEPDDYPPAYFAPGRVLDPANHAWPRIENG